MNELITAFFRIVIYLLHLFISRKAILSVYQLVFWISLGLKVLRITGKRIWRKCLYGKQGCQSSRSSPSLRNLYKLGEEEQAYLEPSWASTMELFAKNNFQRLKIWRLPRRCSPLEKRSRTRTRECQIY